MTAAFEFHLTGDGPPMVVEGDSVENENPYWVVKKGEEVVAKVKMTQCKAWGKKSKSN